MKFSVNGSMIEDGLKALDRDPGDYDEWLVSDLQASGLDYKEYKDASITQKKIKFVQINNPYAKKVELDYLMGDSSLYLNPETTEYVIQSTILLTERHYVIDEAQLRDDIRALNGLICSITNKNFAQLYNTRYSEATYFNLRSVSHWWAVSNMDAILKNPELVRKIPRAGLPGLRPVGELVNRFHGEWRKSFLTKRQVQAVVFGAWQAACFEAYVFGYKPEDSLIVPCVERYALLIKDMYFPREDANYKSLSRMEESYVRSSAWMPESIKEEIDPVAICRATPQGSAVSMDGLPLAFAQCKIAADREMVGNEITGGRLLYSDKYKPTDLSPEEILRERDGLLKRMADSNNVTGSQYLEFVKWLKAAFAGQELNGRLRFGKDKLEGFAERLIFKNYSLYCWTKGARYAVSMSYAEYLQVVMAFASTSLKRIVELFNDFIIPYNDGIYLSDEQNASVVTSALEKVIGDYIEGKNELTGEALKTWWTAAVFSARYEGFGFGSLSSARNQPMDEDIDNILKRQNEEIASRVSGAQQKTIEAAFFGGLATQTIAVPIRGVTTIVGASLTGLGNQNQKAKKSPAKKGFGLTPITDLPPEQAPKGRVFEFDEED